MRRASRSSGEVQHASRSSGATRTASSSPDVDSIARYKAAFAALDRGLPLALLPVRIATRFSPAGAPPELVVRVFPDAIHADAHEPGLTAAEANLGRAFWKRTWRAGGETAGADAAFAWLAGQAGPWRAAWIARTLAPTNPSRAPTAPLAAGLPLDPPPRFPDIEARTSGSPTFARLLPQRFAVAGYVRGELAGTWFGAPIPDGLPLAPGLADAEAGDAAALLDSQGLTWLHDIDAAVQVGMAIRIDLTEAAEAAADGFDRLVVFGVRGDDQREALAALLEAHRYTRGLDLAPQGMPTNRTETAAAALYPDHPDLPALRARELSDQPIPERQALDGDGALYRMTDADAASIALGLGRGDALDRSSQARNAQLPAGEAMNRTLWPAGFGYYLSALLQGVLGEDARSWLRDWSTSFVRGGATLPTVLVGPQPYGLLPVSYLDAHAVQDARTNVEQLERVLVGLRPYWDRSLPSVAHLDPNAADAPRDDLSDGDLAATVSQVLGSVPNPTGLQLRGVDAMRATYTSAYGGRMFLLGLGCSQFPDAHGNPYVDQSQNPAWQRYEKLEADILVDQVWAFESASTDFHHSAGIGGVAFTEQQSEQYDALGTFVDDYLVDLVKAHRDRVAPVAGFLIGQEAGVSFRMGDADDPEAFFAYYGEDGSETPWKAPLVASGRSGSDIASVAAWLAAAVAAAAAPSGGASDDNVAASLLQQLVEAALGRATDPAERRLLAAGLSALQGVVSASADPVGELERLLRETLGTCSYRLDAWYTAVAAWRLEDKRAKRARGLQVGAYGFVVDVRRRDMPASQGYIAAPSLAQATTAAVLRAGWAALGGSEETAGLAVNLSSDRVRRASWIVDGVRRGDDLAVLLGARLERRLHDALLDAWVEPLRQAALDAAGEPSPPNRIVDGLLIARARSGAVDLDREETAARQAIERLLAAPDRPRGDPTHVLDDLVHDLDAVADAATAQSVHALVRGKVPEASASLTAAASGEINFPALTFADTPVAASQITHRLVLLVEPNGKGDWPGSTSSGRALAAPGIEAWAAGVLGAPGELSFTVQFVDAATGAPMSAPLTHTLAETTLSALDVVYLVPGGDATGLGVLGDYLTAWAATQQPLAGAVASVGSAGGAQTIYDVALAARALRRLVAEARDLDARDLAEAGAADTASGLDPDELAVRVALVHAALASGRDALAAALPASDTSVPPAAGTDGARGDVRAAMLALAGFRLSGGVPRTPDEAGLIAQGQALLTLIDERLADFDDRVAAEADGWSDRDEISRCRALTGRVGLLLGEALPLAPRFVASNGKALDTSVARERLSGAAAAMAWLNQAGRVDPGAQRLRQAVDLCEAVADRALFGFRLAQLPDYAEEQWAAVARPSADERGRLCLVVTGATPYFEGDALAGLVLGSWNEAIARSGATAAAAAHFDAASNRAPQAVLLCVAPDAGFDFEGVRDSVVQTLDLARLRMVGPETLVDIGQYLPATYLPDTIDAGGSA